MAAEALIATLLQELDAGALPGTLPVSDGKTTRLPIVCWRQIGGGGIFNHSGQAMDNPTWEFRCWAQTYPEAKALARQVNDLLTTIALLVSGTYDDYEPTTGLHNIVLTASGYFDHESEA